MPAVALDPANLNEAAGRYIACDGDTWMLFTFRDVAQDAYGLAALGVSEDVARHWLATGQRHLPDQTPHADDELVHVALDVTQRERAALAGIVAAARHTWRNQDAQTAMDKLLAGLQHAD